MPSVDAAIREMLDARMAPSEIADKLGVSVHRVYYRMRVNGWKTHPEAKARIHAGAATKRRSTRPEREPGTSHLEPTRADEPVTVRCARCGWATEAETCQAAETFRSHACSALRAA